MNCPLSKNVAGIVVLAIIVSSSAAHDLTIKHDQQTGKISVYRPNGKEPIVTHNVRPDFRPYIHPILAPDGQGVLTEYSPGHHKHQTGLYWGFTRVNGRDYFHHPEGDYWKKVSAKVLNATGHSVKWQSVYDLLSADGKPVLRETQTWEMEDEGDHYFMTLVWHGEAQEDVTIGRYDYGGLFLRMPWKKGIRGEAVNGARQRNERAEGKRSVWLDVGMQVAGRDDLAHIAIFDHGKNPGFPQPWRVDGQLGVGPVRARLGDWHIKKGERAEIKHQIVVYTGNLNDVKLTSQWSRFSGLGGTWSQWGLAQKEGREAEFLTPEKAVEQMDVQDGFKVNMYASEPMITQPMAFCWDDRGRMWIAENRDYETRGRGFSKFGDSRILILEDTDRDGVADKKKVFLEGIPFPAGIAVGFDGLWLGAPPNLLFVPDRDKNDQADVDDMEVRLTGWGIRDRHETLNSFHWGPDGWLYGCQGFATPSLVGKPTGQGRIYRHKDPFPKKFEFADEPVDINGGVWRYHPTKDRFEVVSHGFSNPWGIDYDSKGQFFITACVIPHLWHVIPGGIFHRQGGSHFNPYVYSDIRTIADHRHRSAHGGARIYISDAYPEKYHDRIFMANIHEHAVLTDVLERKGSGFVGHHGDDFALANNAQWIGFSMEIGPEGGIYVLDWHDADICGKDVLNKDTGRVFRIMPEKSLATNWPGRFDDLTKFDDLRLAQLQLSRSAWHARRARIILQYRATQRKIQANAVAELRKQLHAEPITNTDSRYGDPDIRLRALWTLHAIGGLDATAFLNDRDEYLRAWSIQILCEDHNPSKELVQMLESMAKSDSSAVVRLYLAAALQRMSFEQRWGIARNLVQHAEDGDDHNIPKMIWFGIEPLVPDSPLQAIDLATCSKIPVLTRFIARRLADANRFAPVITAIDENADSRLQLLLGLRDGMEGRRNVVAPVNWADVFATIGSDGEIGRVATQLAQQFGDVAATEKMMALLQNPKAKTGDRVIALRGLVNRRTKDSKLPSILLELLDDHKIRRDAIRALAAFDNPNIATELLGRFSRFDQDEKLDVVQTLASRSSFGRTLTDAIRSGDVAKKEIPAYVARQLHRVVGNGFLEVWGPIDSLSENKEAAFKKYKALLTDSAIQSGSPGHGRAIFKKTCSACHKMYGEGGSLGPDITGANRTNLNYVLDNVLTPSAVIQDAYKMTLIITDEGRTYSGILASENERHVQLRIANQSDPVIIPKSQIESRETSAVSMMPDGLLNNFSDQEVIDLMSYLRTANQVALVEAKSSN